MELTSDFRAGRRKVHSFDRYTLNFADSPEEDCRNRYYDTPSDNLEANVGLSWAYLLFSKGFHAVTLSPSIRYGYVHSQQENSLYRLDWLEEMNDADFGTLPSKREALIAALDPYNSYLSTHNCHTILASTAFRYSIHTTSASGATTMRCAPLFGAFRLRLASN